MYHNGKNKMELHDGWINLEWRKWRKGRKLRIVNDEMKKKGEEKIGEWECMRNWL